MYHALAESKSEGLTFIDLGEEDLRLAVNKSENLDSNISEVLFILNSDNKDQFQERLIHFNDPDSCHAIIYGDGSGLNIMDTDLDSFSAASEKAAELLQDGTITGFSYVISPDDVSKLMYSMYDMDEPGM